MVSEFLINLYKNYYIVQNANELDWLVNKIKQIELNTILEIGIEQGGSLKVWEQLLPQNKNSLLIGIDIFPNLSWDISKSNVSIHILKANSHDLSTLTNIKNILNNRKLDFVYIDGEHTSLAVSKDFHFYSPLVRNGGIIGFHDINDIREFLDSLQQNKLEIFYGEKSSIGQLQQIIGTATFTLIH